MKLGKLTPEEEKIIVEKGTEPPFSGEYNNYFKEGTYVCRRCGTPLYASKDKFDSGCLPRFDRVEAGGWPSFDAEIPERVKRIPDPDGSRTEIVCAACRAHLGHVFEGEKKTLKNIRHCVNSLSIRFISKKRENKNETVIFGGGCFWCIEALFLRIKGVKEVTPGYAGGDLADPSYAEVSSGSSGHAEVIKIEYDPSVIDFDDLLEVFFTTHDPTTLNRQGNDVGSQYRSIILYDNEKQKKAAEAYIKKLTDEKVFEKPIVTEISPLGSFYDAEEYHRRYYDQNKQAPYCRYTILPKLSKLKSKFGRLLR